MKNPENPEAPGKNALVAAALGRCCPDGPPVSSSLPPAGQLPFRRWLQVVVGHVSMNGPPTRDFHSIYNAPMLGAHKSVNRYGSPAADGG